MHYTSDHPNVKQCEFCGAEFVPRYDWQKFCKAKCRNANRLAAIRQPLPESRQCEFCGAEFVPHALAPNRQRFCSAKCKSAWNTINARAAITCTCKQCGVQYQPKAKNRDQFCSRECFYANRAERKAANRAEREKAKLPMPQRTCEICGKLFNSKWSSKTCSDECRRERNSRKAQERFKANDERDRRPRACKECGAMFVPEYGNKRRVFCSKKCSRKNSKKNQLYNGKNINAVVRKRLRDMYGERWREMYEPINKMRVFRRDRWTCQLCGCKVKRTTEYHVKQATIDHIVPIALGGEHKYSNVQTACMKCNSKKGATVQGQQRLLG